MTIKRFYFNPLRECCYVLWDDSRECAIIDPGFMTTGEFDRLKKFIQEQDLKPVKILLTHCHFDHVLGLEEACRFWNLKPCFCKADEVQLERAPRYCIMLGIEMQPYTGEGIYLTDGDVISFGNTELKVIATPGHTEGGVCFLNEKEQVIFTGDTLFAASIGRTDHLGGNLETLMDSILNRLMVLPGDTIVYPGHGADTNIGYERATNPFLMPV